MRSFPWRFIAWMHPLAYYALPHPRLVSARELDALPAYPKLLAVAELDEVARRLGIVLEHARELTIQMRRCGSLQARDDADALHGQHRRADGQRYRISRAELDAVQLRGFVKLKDGRARAVVSAVLAHEPFNAHLMREAISMQSACNQPTSPYMFTSSIWSRLRRQSACNQHAISALRASGAD